MPQHILFWEIKAFKEFSLLWLILAGLVCSGRRDNSRRCRDRRNVISFISLALVMLALYLKGSDFQEDDTRSIQFSRCLYPYLIVMKGGERGA